MILGHKYICLTCDVMLGQGEFGRDMDIIYGAILQHLAENPDHEVVERFVLVQ